MTMTNSSGEVRWTGGTKWVNDAHTTCLPCLAGEGPTADRMGCERCAFN
eukprot:SAG22_NODE_14485_length_373_cov_0.989051_1_plen_48_part_10